jgi:hypothetical protein
MNECLTLWRYLFGALKRILQDITGQEHTKTGKDWTVIRQDEVVQFYDRYQAVSFLIYELWKFN